MQLIKPKADPIELPKPLGSWVLVRKEKKGSSLILPDSAGADAFNFIVEAVGPDVHHLELERRIELQPRAALANGVMLADNYALLRAMDIVGQYP